MTFARSSLVFCLSVLAAAGLARAAEPETPPKSVGLGFDVANMDTKADACTDF